MKLWNVYEEHTIHIGVVGSDEQDSADDVLEWAKKFWDCRTRTVTPVMHLRQKAVETAKAKQETEDTPKTDVGYILQSRAFLKDLLDRDMFAYAVSEEVRREARRLLGGKKA